MVITLLPYTNSSSLAKVEFSGTVSSGISPSSWLIRKAMLWIDLLGECDSRCGDLHRTREEEDCDCYGCGLCTEEAGQDFVWIWWLE